MWCLWNLGLLGEPLVGPFGLIAIYLLTGIAGNLLSVAWDVILASIFRQPLEFYAGMGAGASGAVFGDQPGDRRVHAVCRAGADR